MNFSIPIYVSRHQDDLYRLRPLFVPDITGQHRDLDRGLAHLTEHLRRELQRLNKEVRHDQLARYTFSPRLHDHHLKLSLVTRKQTWQIQWLCVTFKHWDRWLACVPLLDNLWFEFDRPEDLPERASEVLIEYLHAQEPDETAAIPLEEDAWMTSIEIDLAIQTTVPKADVAEQPRFLLWGGGEMQGSEELESVGRCLNWLYPDGLRRAFFRERELEELRRVLADERKRPVALIGPMKVGKTAIIHEHVRQIMLERGKQGRTGQYWNLAPQRLIAGMSYVGQWEERILAILKEARKRRHVLYFDDFLGLYQTGVSAGSDLSVAHVLKPYVEQRDVSILVEMTPEHWRVLQELDRGFADLFFLIHVREPGRAETLRILVKLMRELEGRHQCQFHPGVLPLVIDLQRRYARQLAFPGKAADFLEHLAAKFHEKPVKPPQVLEEFHLKSGLSLAMLDDRVAVTWDDTVRQLREQIVGQPQALEVLADVVSIAKARLNDPTRPLASLLFLGPTGVGKTQCAKALTTYLFGQEEHLLRFDMNEYVDADAIPRLIGTFYQPEGLLTSAVRRRPFAVVLFDEIEKAHPDVFDLLLQVLDDGRLTDARGRTTDFTNTIIIMTSNLGVREAGSRLGFHDDQKHHPGQVFSKAAEQFFRPEFFNRLDRIIPFNPLSPQDIRAIAQHIITQIFQRHGLTRRQCVLSIAPQVIADLAERGYHPQLGARALKRAAEQMITYPLAAKLASLNPQRPTVIALSKPADDVLVEVEELREAAPQPCDIIRAAQQRPREIIAAVEEFLIRSARQLETYRPLTGVAPTALTIEQRFYYEAHDRLMEIRSLIDAYLSSRKGPARAFTRLPTKAMSPRHSRKRAQHRFCDTPTLQEVWGADNLRDAIANLTHMSAPLKRSPFLLEILYEAALLQAMLDAGPMRLQQRALVTVTSVGVSAKMKQRFCDIFREEGLRVLNLTSHRLDENHFSIEGALACQLLQGDAGTHLFIGSQGTLGLICVTIQEMLDAQQPADRHSPVFPEVIRIYEQQTRIWDVRTGLTLDAGELTPEDHRVLLINHLPLPPELLGNVQR